MPDALIGGTGFVGSTLLMQRPFDQVFRSTNIGEINGKIFDLVVCAAAPAQKWIANREPEADRLKIERLISHLETVRCRKFVLVSTVDVFRDPVLVDEDTLVEEDGLHAYGLHRRLLEKFVEARFPDSLVVRLPGLVGPGLRKNVIFDMLNNNLHAIESRSAFQFFPMVNLWYDIRSALEAGPKLVHLTAEPIRVSELSQACFGKRFEQTLSNPPAAYDMQTKFAGRFGGGGRYQYSKRETILAVRAYAQSEPLTYRTEGK
jgi:dTDP-4-dehydrorhamnose reductase